MVEVLQGIAAHTKFSIHYDGRVAILEVEQTVTTAYTC